MSDALLQELTTELSAHGQQHLLAFWDELGAAEREQLGAQIRAIDFAELARLVGHQQQAPDWGALARRADSPPAFRRGQGGPGATVDQALAKGREALSRG